MRSFRPAFPLFLLSIPMSVAAAQKPFEGRVVMEMKGEGRSGEPMEMWIRGNQVRMDMGRDGQSFGMIIDHGASRMTMLMSEAKMYMQQPLPKGDDAESEAKITRTGKTATVAGHRCEIIRVEDKKGDTAEICGATDMGRFAMGGGPGAGKPPAWAKGMKGFFPLRVTDGKGVTVLEVTEIDAGPVDAARFAIPPGFKPMSMPGR